tara:strand:+ start:10112 stop:10582 length:471 start_codon:yes stop_codon:yes gene_type:complete
MGYTHYWRLDKKKLSKTAFENVAYDMTRIEQAMSKQGVRLGGWDGETSYVQYDVVHQGKAQNVTAFRFNGIGTDSHEAFSLVIGTEGFNCCKTACKPYDLAVCLILMSLKHHEPSAVIRTDGTTEDWSIAFDKYKEIFPKRTASFSFNNKYELTKS